MVMKILVPFDFSEPSAKALRHAMTLSGVMSSKNEVIVLHVIEELSTRMALEQAFGTGRWKEEEERRKKEGKETELGEYEQDLVAQMERYAKRIAEEVGAGAPAMRYLIRVGGRPADRILEVAKEESCDLVVLGSVGHSGLAKMLKMGSVSREVLEKSPCPATIVH
ncbi:MAG: universal stress protein [Nitrososphaera sp.]|nr:universal stress protein [Nitrososphaera sp.]